MSIGDTVSLSLGSRNLLQAAMIVYGWPLLGASLATLLAKVIDLTDAGAALAALAGIAVGAILVRIRLGHRDCLTRFVPTVVGRVGENGS